MRAQASPLGLGEILSWTMPRCWFAFTWVRWRTVWWRRCVRSSPTERYAASASCVLLLWVVRSCRRPWSWRSPSRWIRWRRCLRHPSFRLRPSPFLRRCLGVFARAQPPSEEPGASLEGTLGLLGAVGAGPTPSVGGLAGLAMRSDRSPFRWEWSYEGTCPAKKMWAMDACWPSSSTAPWCLACEGARSGLARSSPPALCAAAERAWRVPTARRRPLVPRACDFRATSLCQDRSSFEYRRTRSPPSRAPYCW